MNYWRGWHYSYISHTLLEQFMNWRVLWEIHCCCSERVFNLEFCHLKTRKRSNRKMKDPSIDSVVKRIWFGIMVCRCQNLQMIFEKFSSSWELGWRRGCASKLLPKHKKRTSPKGGVLFLPSDFEGSNPSKCHSPVDCGNDQFKNWSSPYSLPLANWQSNPSSSAKNAWFRKKLGVFLLTIFLSPARKSDLMPTPPFFRKAWGLNYVQKTIFIWTIPQNRRGSV